jgi:signal transduction histidine kinase
MDAVVGRPGAGMNETLRAWALISVSLFNTVILLWLGLTLLLHAEPTDARHRRDPGVVLAGGGFLLGSLFFFSHSALLLSPSWELTRSNTLWLAVAMLPVLILPYVWYIVLLRNAGYWTGNAGLRNGHRPGLLLVTGILVLGFAALILLGIPFIPGLSRLTAYIWPLRQLIKIPVLGIPLVALAYPLYVLLCVAFSVDTLRTQMAESSPAGAGAEAFRRSRAQLIAASLVLLVVSLLVAVAVVWTISNTREGDYYALRTDDVAVLAGFDFVIALLIAVVAVLLGQAMTRYELFTGKALPQRGLARYWAQALALAAGYAALLGGALAWGLDPVYAVLLTALLMTAFFALLGWRATVEWRRAMRELRPIVRSEGWYEQLTSQDEAREGDAEPLRVLCEDVLRAPLAFLIPAGPLAAFVAPQAYPLGTRLPVHASSTPPPSPHIIAVPVTPQEHGGASVAIPLWSERGLIGTLLLGSRSDGSLYGEEELEIARATGERLIDAAASVGLSQKLMALQRDRMAQTQLLDQRTRRVLHDEVLPLIHTAMLTVSAGQDRGVALQRLSEAHAQISALLRDLPAATTPDVARLGPLAALRKAVEGEFGSAFEAVTWEVDQDAERAAASLPSLRAETLYFAGRELVRNAARHARREDGESVSLLIVARCADGRLELTVEDNGSGWDAVVPPGHGLELHTALMAIAGGSLSVEGVTEGTRGSLSLPLGGG